MCGQTSTLGATLGAGWTAGKHGAGASSTHSMSPKGVGTAGCVRQGKGCCNNTRVPHPFISIFSIQTWWHTWSSCGLVTTATKGAGPEGLSAPAGDAGSGRGGASTGWLVNNVLTRRCERLDADSRMMSSSEPGRATYCSRHKAERQRLVPEPSRCCNATHNPPPAVQCR